MQTSWLLALLGCGSAPPSSQGLPPTDPVPSETAATLPTADTAPPPPTARLRGRFESGGPITACGTVRDGYHGADGTLIRASMDLCGDDMGALADTLRANLDAVHARGDRALVVLAQGTVLPQGWLAGCETYTLDSGNFSGPLCLPWDPHYQASLEEALSVHLGPAIHDHPALAGVYFTLSTMTNGAEMHFRVARSDFPAEPSPGAFTASYLQAMDSFQQAFDVPILFEGGHCIFDLPGVTSGVDCATPVALYRHARDTYGQDAVGVALWNCAERFWHGPTASEHAVRPLLEELTADGAALGCQTVGNFTQQPCRFSDPAVGDYGALQGIGSSATCTPNTGDDAERACVDTLGWFAGTTSQSSESVALQGSWVENWSADVAPGGIAQTSASCATALDAFAP